MAEMFKTCLRVSARATGEEWDNLRAAAYEKYQSLSKGTALVERIATRDWGTDFRHQSEHQRILSPAGRWILIPLDSEETCFVCCRQIEIARYGLPDLYAAKLTMFDRPNDSLQDISELVPANSVDEAVDRFRKALNCQASNALVAALRDSMAVRVFGAAASPDCLDSVLKISVPTLAEIQDALNSLLAAATPLREVIESLQGSDAFQYIVQNARTRSGARAPVQRFSLEAFCEALTLLSERHGVPERRPGRRVKGGKENAIALSLSTLWQMCLLGEPKYAQQSRFVRACTIVLPWYGVHKADVAQFVKGEMKKERSQRTSSGYVIKG